MAIQLNEPAVKALRARLVANLDTAINAINAAVTDGFTIDHVPSAQVFDFVPPPGVLLAFPTIGIGDGPSTFEDDEGFSATGRHELLVVIYDQHADQQTLAWRLRRYEQALVAVTLSGRQLEGGGAWGTGLVRVVPGPTLVDDAENPQTYLSWAGIQVWAKRDEE